ncbi:MAG: autotransporter outer membrane beta-barrel domain-containing protein [Planctomycetia bacterium]|nr:autotransporter outer membrane beta-barrel domain-containing protein [Planctomycetia bacterium]
MKKISRINVLQYLIDVNETFAQRVKTIFRKNKVFVKRSGNFVWRIRRRFIESNLFLFFICCFFLSAENSWGQNHYWSATNGLSTLLKPTDFSTIFASSFHILDNDCSLDQYEAPKLASMNSESSLNSGLIMKSESFSGNKSFSSFDSQNIFLESSDSNLFLNKSRLISENATNFPTNDFQPTFSTSSILRGNISELSIEPYKGRITGNVFGEWATIDKQGKEATQSGFKTNVLGGGLGQDRLLGDYVIWGFWLNGLSQKMTMTDDRYSGSIQSFSGRLHLSILGTIWYTDLAIGVGKNWNKHQVNLSKANEFVNKYTGTQWNYEGEFGLRIFKGHTKIEPFLGLRVINLDEPGTAGIFPESTIYIPSSYSFNSYRIMLGSRLAWEYSSYLANICPIMQAAWVHEFGDTEVFTTNDFLPFPVAYQFGNHKQGRDRFILGAGLTIALKDSFDLYCFYNSTIVNNYQSSNIWGGFNKKF